MLKIMNTGGGVYTAVLGLALGLHLLVVPMAQAQQLVRRVLPVAVPLHPSAGYEAWQTIHVICSGLCTLAYKETSQPEVRPPRNRALDSRSEVERASQGLPPRRFSEMTRMHRRDWLQEMTPTERDWSRRRGDSDMQRRDWSRRAHQRNTELPSYTPFGGTPHHLGDGGSSQPPPEASTS